MRGHLLYAEGERGRLLHLDSESSFTLFCAMHCAFSFKGEVQRDDIQRAGREKREEDVCWALLPNQGFQP